MHASTRAASVGALLCMVLGLGALAAVPSLEQFDERETEVADWTIAVYIAADNDLEPFALLDLKEMERGVSGNVNVIALVDRAEGYDTSDGDWTDARVFRITPDASGRPAQARIIARVGEVNMGDPLVLETFLRTTLRDFPARRHALVMWNHGGGWTLHATDHGMPDGKPGSDALTLPQLSSAIGNALASVQIERFDLIGFDMCLMAQLEVAVEIAPFGRVMVASQATEPGDGWPYDRVLSAFAEPRNDAAQVARHIIDQFDGYYREKNEAITTLSAFDLDALPAFTRRLDELLAALEPRMVDVWPDITRAVYFAEGYAPRSELQRSNQALASIDLLDAWRRVEQTAANFPRRELRALEQAHDALVLSSKTSPIHRLSNGLAIYAPVRQQTFNDDYAFLEINRTSRWPAFLGRLHQLQQAEDRAPVIRDLRLVDWNAGKAVDAARPLNTHGIDYVVEGRNLLKLNGMNGQWDEQREGILVLQRGAVVDANWSIRARDTASDRLDLLMPQFIDGKNPLVTSIPGYRYAVSDGGKQAHYATVDESGESGDHILVPILFHHPELGDVGGTVYFHPQWWYAAAVQLELVQPDGSAVYRQIKPQAEHEITLLFEYLTRDGQLSYRRGSRIPWGDGPELLLSLDEPGSYVFGVVAETFGGKSAHALHEYRMDSDPDLDAFIKAGSGFDRDDLVGTWEMLEPEPFMKGGQMIPNGVLLEYKPHPERPTLLLSEMTAPQRNPNLSSRSLVFLDTRMLSHTRSFKTETAGMPDDPLGVDFSVELINLYLKDGRPVMITRNTTSGLSYVFGRTSPGRAGASAPPAPQGQAQPAYAPPQPPDSGASSSGNWPAPAALGLDGVWQSQDGTVLIVQADQYQVSRFGSIADGGMLHIVGNVLTSQSAYTGSVDQYQFMVHGQILQLMDAWGGVYVYQRLQSP